MDDVAGAFDVDAGASHSLEVVLEVVLVSVDVGAGSSTLGFDLIMILGSNNEGKKIGNEKKINVYPCNTHTHTHTQLT